MPFWLEPTDCLCYYCKLILKGLMSMIKLTLQDLQWEELNEDKDLCGFDGSANAASDGSPRRGNTSGAGSIAHYQGPCWIISEQWDPVTGTNKHILHFPIKLPLVATSTAQINVIVYLITEVVGENILDYSARKWSALNRFGWANSWMWVIMQKY